MIDRRCSVVAAIGIGLATALPVSAQSLADVARQEAARRDVVKPAPKAYINAGLHADPLATPVPVSGAGEAEPGRYLSISAGRYVAAAEIIFNSAANPRHRREGLAGAGLAPTGRNPSQADVQELAGRRGDSRDGG